MNIFVKSLNLIEKMYYWVLFLVFFFLYLLMGRDANSSQTYYEGHEADSIIKSGELQEKVVEEDHTHLILEYKDNVFWCTVENNGKKFCEEY